MKSKMLSPKTKAKIFCISSLLILFYTQYSLLAQDNQLRNLFRKIDYSLSNSQEQALQGILSQESTIEATVVAIDREALSSDEVINFNISEETNFETITSKRDIRSFDKFTWHGHVKDQESNIVLAIHKDAVAGYMVLANKAYNIRPLGGGLSAIVRVDPAKYLPCDTNSGNVDGNTLGLNDLTLFNNSSAMFPTKYSNKKVSANNLNTSVDTIKVLFAYTAAAKSQAGGFNGINAVIDLAETEANDSYILSENIPIRIKVAHRHEVSYTETNSSGAYTDESECAVFEECKLNFKKIPLLDLQNSSDDEMDEVHDLRGIHGADVVVLLTSSTVGGCGQAYQIGANYHEAFCIVQQSCAGASGNWSVAHEIGHLFGARHQPEADECNCPNTFGHGRNGHPDFNWRTMMAIPKASEPRIPKWASPIVYEGDEPTGDADHDTRLVLINNASFVADFVKERSGLLNNTTLSGIVLITDDVTFTGSNFTSSNAQIFVKDNVEITISNGATLTINSGTILKFANNAGLTVNGTLNANRHLLPASHLHP